MLGHYYLVQGGPGLGFILVTHWRAFLPDQLVGHVSGFGHLGGVEHHVDVVAFSRDRMLEGERLLFSAKSFIRQWPVL